MRRAFLVSIFFIFLPTIALAWVPITITRVIDGDTIAARVEGQGEEIRIRLYGIDAPEKGQDFGQAATRNMQGMTKGSAEMKAMDHDRYGRSVALVRVNGQNLSEQMIADGFAWVYDQYCNADFCSSWRQQQEAARVVGKGLWWDRNAQPPWDFRHGVTRAKIAASPLLTAQTGNGRTLSSVTGSQTYTGNTRSKKFHRASCVHANCPHCTATFANREQAISAGYIPCKVCNP